MRTNPFLKKRCKHGPLTSGRRNLRRILEEGVHPKLRIPLDGAPAPYAFDEMMHGPSMHSVRVRRLVRQQANRANPWPEESGEHPASTQRYSSDPTVECTSDGTDEGVPVDPWAELQDELNRDFFDEGIDGDPFAAV